MATRAEIAAALSSSGAPWTESDVASLLRMPTEVFIHCYLDGIHPLTGDTCAGDDATLVALGRVMIPVPTPLRNMAGSDT